MTLRVHLVQAEGGDDWSVAKSVTVGSKYSTEYNQGDHSGCRVRLEKLSYASSAGKGRSTSLETSRPRGGTVAGCLEIVVRVVVAAGEALDGRIAVVVGVAAVASSSDLILTAHTTELGVLGTINWSDPTL